jgi:hypothetical protein
MQRRWTEVQEYLAKPIIQVGLEILEENLHIECELSPLGGGGRHALDMGSDTRWDKRGSTCHYDSLSGCAVAFGLRMGSHTTQACVPKTMLGRQKEWKLPVRSNS